MNDGMSDLKKWYYSCTRNSIFDPTKQCLEIIVILTVAQRIGPHGFEKSPVHEIYSSKILKAVRVREVRGSNPVPRLESTRLTFWASRVTLNGTLSRGLETAGLKALNGKGASRAHHR